MSQILIGQVTLLRNLLIKFKEHGTKKRLRRGDISKEEAGKLIAVLLERKHNAINIK